MLKCPICNNLYPFNYKKCIKCKNNLVREEFAPQIKEVETVEEITPFIEFTELKDFES